MTGIEGVIEFNKERQLTIYDAGAEYRCIQEELQEYLYAKNEAEEVDALCDIIVFAVGALYKLGYNPEQALSETVKEIRSRKGEFNYDTGKWEKYRDQDPATLYKANYGNARLE